MQKRKVLKLSVFWFVFFVGVAKNHSNTVGEVHSNTPTAPTDQKTLLPQTPTDSNTTPTEKQMANNRVILIYIVLKMNILYYINMRLRKPCKMRLVGLLECWSGFLDFFCKKIRTFLGSCARVCVYMT